MCDPKIDDNIKRPLDPDPEEYFNGTNYSKKLKLCCPTLDENNNLNENNTDDEAVDGFIWCSDYANCILELLFTREKCRMQFLNRSPQAPYRSYYVNLILALAHNGRISRTAVHLGVYFLDIYMDNHTIFPHRMTLVTLVALLLGCKIEDSDVNRPSVASLAINSNEICLTDYAKMERKMLEFFDWNLLIPTAANFIEYYIEYVVDRQDYELVNNYTRFCNYRAMKLNVIDLVFEYLNLTLNCVHMVQERPSKMAAACIAAARKTSNIGTAWNGRLINLTQYTYDELENCVTHLIYNRTQILCKSVLLDNTPESDYYSG